MKDMSEITIPETTISEMQLEYNLRQLAAAICYQGVKDYCKLKSIHRKQVILDDLRTPYMDFITSGISTVAAEQLEKNEEEIKARIFNESEEM